MEQSVCPRIDLRYMKGRSYLQIVEAIIAAGVKVIQFFPPPTGDYTFYWPSPYFSEKHRGVTTRELLAIVSQIQELSHKNDVSFIINNRVDLALILDLDGVQLGQNAMPVKYAKKLLGDKLVGVSVRTVRQAIQAQAEGADYVNVGSVFHSFTKPVGDPTGVETVSRIKEAVQIPVTASSGIDMQNVASVINAGADGVIVSFAVLTAPDITQATRAFLAEVADAKLAKHKMF